MVRRVRARSEVFDSTLLQLEANEWLECDGMHIAGRGSSCSIRVPPPRTAIARPWGCVRVKPRRHTSSCVVVACSRVVRTPVAVRSRVGRNEMLVWAHPLRRAADAVVTVWSKAAEHRF